MRRLQPIEHDTYNLRSLQAITRKPRFRNQSKCHFPLHNNCITYNHSDLEEPHLPNYVVPVLYVPRRIITNDELIGNHTYKLNEDFSSARKERPTSPSYSLNQKQRTPTKLTQSETEIYKKLMESMYGVKSPEEVDYYKGDYNSKRSDLNDHQIGECEIERTELNQNYYVGLETESNSNFLRTFRKRTPCKLSPIYSTQSHILDDVSLFVPSHPNYSGHSIKPDDLDLNKPEKDNKATATEISHEENDLSANKEKTILQPRELIETASQYSTRSLFKDQEQEEPESKCTQTMNDNTVSTQTTDMTDLWKKQAVQCDIAKEDVRSISTEAILIEKIMEDVGTNAETDGYVSDAESAKCNKSTDSIPTVDLLPVTSSTIRKLRTIEEKCPTSSRLPMYKRCQSPPRNQFLEDTSPKCSM